MQAIRFTNSVNTREEKWNSVEDQRIVAGGRYIFALSAYTDSAQASEGQAINSGKPAIRSQGLVSTRQNGIQNIPTGA
jgi:hypothetical protein